MTRPRTGADRNGKMARSLDPLRPEPPCHHPVEVVPYDPRWPALFEAEAAALRDLIGAQWALRIEHIGSTAVPGLVAKPVIDLQIEVPDLSGAREVLPALVAPRGYAAIWRSDRPAPWLMLARGYSEPASPANQVYHAHLAGAGHPIWERLAFRDWLRDHPDDAARYGALKQKLAASLRDDRDGYTAAKGAFVHELTSRAVKRGDPPLEPSRDLGQ